MAGSLEQDIPKVVRALGRAFREEGRADIASVLLEARVAFPETSFDNWNGGTYGYTLRLGVPARIFARLGIGTEAVEQDIRSRVEKFAKAYPNQFVESVLIIPDLEEEDSAVHAEATPSFWREGHLRLFLSHASDFQLEASKIAESLINYNVHGFVAHEQIAPAKEWEDELRLGLSTCDALVCFLSEGFKKSDWTEQEVGFVISRRVLVIPVRLGLNPYGFMARYQGCSGVGKNPPELARELVSILANHQLTSMKMANALVHSFEGSSSFAEAKIRASNLSLVQRWTDSLVERARRALKENDQIGKAWGVPNIVEGILSRMEPS
jgi:hypothetical protein